MGDDANDAGVKRRTFDLARRFVRHHSLPPPSVEWVSGVREVALGWEDPEGYEWSIAFTSDGSVVVDSEFLEDRSLGALPVEREVAAAVALIRRWNGIEPEGPIPGIDTPLVVVSIDNGWMVEDYLFDYANRTVERSEGRGEEDLSDMFSSLLEAGTIEWSWDGSPETLADRVEAAGFDVDSWHIWGGPQRSTPTVGEVGAADTFDALIAEASDASRPLVDAAAFPSIHELPTPDAARRRGSGVDLEWGTGDGVVTLRFRGADIPDVRLATIWGVDSVTYLSSDPLVRQIRRVLNTLWLEA